ncbi:MAG: hypothetical protein JXQ65_12390 [Candidatus Marinimicrobia bacterium]|nr:hypothetical protein [Candidatus Neomarinimicrobiota bacterium]
MKVLKITFVLLLFIFSSNIHAQTLSQDGEKIVIAVVDFRNTGGDPKLNYLEKTIPENIITRMAKNGRTEIVERTRLEDALKELELGISGIVDEQSAVELGRAVGANAILLGSFASIGQKIRINARLIDVKSSRIIKADVVEGNVSDEIFMMMDRLAYSMESQLLNKENETLQYQAIPINREPVADTRIKEKKPLLKRPIFWVASAAIVGGGVYLATQESSSGSGGKMSSVSIIINLP